jgi:hypothetical protein
MLCLNRNILLIKNKQITSRKKRFHNKDQDEKGKKLKACLVVKTNKHQR